MRARTHTHTLTSSDRPQRGSRASPQTGDQHSAVPAARASVPMTCVVVVDPHGKALS
eukprot:SAG22_NODE_764_length_7397_cov_6.955604_2_plen_57_part_00